MPYGLCVLWTVEDRVESRDIHSPFSPSVDCTYAIRLCNSCSKLYVILEPVRAPIHFAHYSQGAHSLRFFYVLFGNLSRVERLGSFFPTFLCLSLQKKKNPPGCLSLILREGAVNIRYRKFSLILLIITAYCSLLNFLGHYFCTFF